MNPNSRVTIQTDDFDVSAEIAALRSGDNRVGAVCSFLGTVRDHTIAPPSDGVPARNTSVGVIASMELEHYPGMTERAIEAMIDLAVTRFDIISARVIHRVGVLLPTDQIVLVLASAAHRGQSFQACEFLMDYLKTQAPFWKKEHSDQGPCWVDARVSDDRALARWGVEVSNAG
jgi:molybdopterin synthase catalytic subunit